MNAPTVPANLAQQPAMDFVQSLGRLVALLKHTFLGEQPLRAVVAVGCRNVNTRPFLDGLL